MQGVKNKWISRSTFVYASCKLNNSKFDITSARLSGSPVPPKTTSYLKSTNWALETAEESLDFFDGFAISYKKISFKRGRGITRASSTMFPSTLDSIDEINNIGDITTGDIWRLFIYKVTP